MAKTLEEARQEGEARIGRRLTEREYFEAVMYAARKSRLTGHDPSYILLLLPDVIYEQEYSRKSLERYKAARLDEKELEKWTKAFSEEQERLKRLHSDRSNFTAAAPAV